MDRFEYFEMSELRIGLIVSADLAHTHLKDGPYGYCECAEPYDQAVGKWAQTMNSDYLLKNASLQQKIGAMSCGFTGFVFWQGMINEAMEHGITFNSNMLANYHPTYYGMMVANFTRIY